MAERTSRKQRVVGILDASRAGNLAASAAARPSLQAAVKCFVLSLAVLRPYGLASAADAPAAQDNGANAAQATHSGRRREDLRYARRSFEEWRDQLLNDLDPKTCIEAMAPMTAFGKRGYAADAIAALAEVLRSDRTQESAAAAGALAKIGPAALPMLADGLADERLLVRYACTQAVMSLGAEGKSAAPALVKLLSDQELQVRVGAVHSLLAVAGDDMALWPTFERLADSNDSQIRYSLAAGLSAHPPQGRWWLRPLLRLADDPNDGIRAAVGGILAQYGPPEKAVIDAVERLIWDDQQNVSNATIGKLAQQGTPGLLAAVFADAFESPDWWQRFRQHARLDRAIARLASFPKEAETVAPLLAKIIESKEPGWLQNETIAAIDGLGSVGPAAKIAYPTLKRIIQSPDLPDDDPLKKHARRSLDKILATDEPAADHPQP